MKTEARTTTDQTLHQFRRNTALTLLAAWGSVISLSAGEASTSGGPEGFVLVKGGTFQMGDLWGDGSFAMGEAPVHDVTVGDFLLGKYEATMAEFGRFVAATGYETEAEAAAGTVANRGAM